ncbi:thioesterase [Shewanella sp. VB17]|uniref:thioesterase II family protein n=1 Tax=Shewanella sp. VB17 TaxID=2739432 RepID=UPI0015650F5B|nr:alpha/beta fold hydrolase [Shewanella sp. VB17]NRD75046.1 thioesterase [Shewanella sp. VB17]
MNIYNNDWFVIPKPNPNSTLTLICFPYAGGSAQVFMQWVKALPANTEVVIIQAPGRGARMGELAYSDMNLLIKELIKFIPPLLDKPYVLFGHSLGSRIAFELMSQINKLRLTLPKHFIASGSRGPHLKSIKRSVYHLPDNEFIKELEELNGTPKAVLENKELMELFLPLLRADFEISDRYCYQEDDKYAVDLTVLGGEDDTITFETLESWGDFFTQEKKVTLLKGDHFFIDSHRDLVLQQVSNILELTTKSVKNDSSCAMSS